MLAPILLLILGAFAATPKLYNLEKIRDTIPLNMGQRVTIEAIEDPGAKEVWVIGNYDSGQIICEDGRMGDRYKDRNLPGKPWVQKFTFMLGAYSGPDEFAVEMWFIHPHHAEQYFNDPDAYIKTHGEEPFKKKIKFKQSREQPDL